ncbi:NAD(P)-dependent oxidoreductase [uncultured Robinsoniella sp.]|uniref:NAD(P)-dependent oxidoreductase n=1 Tax=uncultured Robinsoniella sp. TaxID=904190 RepID=UPI00374EC766
MKKIGFIGVGIMGKSMVRNLMKAGYEVSFYARNKSKTEDVIAEGAVYHSTIPECVNGCDAVITIVGFPNDVRAVYFGKDGILENVPEGTYVIDMTTSSPKLAEEIYEEAKKRGIYALDAPVTGGDVGAKNGTLSILAGGDSQSYEKCLPVFEAMGKNIHLEGKAGSGQHTKMVNQIMIAGTISGICEAFAYAREKGLDIPTVLDSVATGAAGSKQLELQAAKMLEQDYAPGFFIKHFIKDMKLAKEEAEGDGLSLKVLNQTLAAYEELEKRGDGELGTQALIKYFDKL